MQTVSHLLRRFIAVSYTVRQSSCEKPQTNYVDSHSYVDSQSPVEEARSSYVHRQSPVN
jgi:hypothetical protein